MSSEGEHNLQESLLFEWRLTHVRLLIERLVVANECVVDGNSWKRATYRKQIRKANNIRNGGD